MLLGSEHHIGIGRSIIIFIILMENRVFVGLDVLENSPNFAGAPIKDRKCSDSDVIFNGVASFLHSALLWEHGRKSRRICIAEKKSVLERLSPPNRKSIILDYVIRFALFAIPTWTNLS